MVPGLESLHLFDGRDWQLLPAWCRFFLQLGCRVGEVPVNERRLVVAVSIPTRALAAAFACAGVVAGRIFAGLSPDRWADHFALLCSVGVGTPVVLTRGPRQFQGEILGPATYAGESWIRVRIQRQDAGGETHFVPERECSRVSLLAETPSLLPGQPHGVTAVARAGFLEAVLGYDGAHALYAETSIECLVVGQVGALRRELDLPVGVLHGEGAVEEGRLGDLARTRQVVGPGRTYRSYAVTATSAELPAAPRPRPAVVVFDGALGFLKWRHRWSDTHWVVILDRTEPRCVDGANELNARYAGRSLGLAQDAASLPRPRAVEVMAYWELVQ